VAGLLGDRPDPLGGADRRAASILLADPHLPSLPAEFRKLDAVAVLTARLLPAPPVVPGLAGELNVPAHEELGCHLGCEGGAETVERRGVRAGDHGTELAAGDVEHCLADGVIPGLIGVPEFLAAIRGCGGVRRLSGRGIALRTGAAGQ
jgi:hypothetical protein